MPTNATAAPWTCATCGATTTDAGRRLMGPLCWLCSGTLYRDDEPNDKGRDWPHTLTEPEGGRHE